MKKPTKIVAEQPPEYIMAWVKQYGPGRVLEAMEVAYTARLQREIAASTLDLSMQRFQTDLAALKAFVNETSKL